MPMCPELVVAFFAVIKIGADRPAAVLRLRRRTPSPRGSTTPEAAALVIADGFWRRGQRVAMKAVADQAPSRPRHRCAT